MTWSPNPVCTLPYASRGVTRMSKAFPAASPEGSGVAALRVDLVASVAAGKTSTVRG